MQHRFRNDAILYMIFLNCLQTKLKTLEKEGCLIPFSTYWTESTEIWIGAPSPFFVQALLFKQAIVIFAQPGAVTEPIKDLYSRILFQVVLPQAEKCIAHLASFHCSPDINGSLSVSLHGHHGKCTKTSTRKVLCAGWSQHSQIVSKTSHGVWSTLTPDCCQQQILFRN